MGWVGLKNVCGQSLSLETGRSTYGQEKKEREEEKREEEEEEEAYKLGRLDFD